MPFQIKSNDETRGAYWWMVGHPEVEVFARDGKCPTDELPVIRAQLLSAPSTSQPHSRKNGDPTVSLVALSL